MANDRPPPGAPASLEEERRQFASALMKASLNFLEVDNKINSHLEDMLGTVASYVKANPRTFESTTDIERAIQELKNRMEQGKPGGADTAGGGPLQDIIDLISSLLNPLKSEKEFFMQIIRLVFCGCDDK